MDSETYRSKIIEYWSTAGLRSAEASSAGGDPDVAYLDHAIEERILAEILGGGTRMGRVLDVGAGYGRFTDVFLDRFARVCLLDAAPTMLRQLDSRWGGHERVVVSGEHFEAFDPGGAVDVVFASGVVYLYDDVMLERFFEKARDTLAPGGRIILRDFLCPVGKVIDSAAVAGGFCHYRSVAFWKTWCKNHGLTLVSWRRSKPHLRFLRRPRLLRALALARIKRLAIRSELCRLLAMSWGSWRLDSDDIHTVFLECCLDVRTGP